MSLRGELRQDVSDSNTEAVIKNLDIFKIKKIRFNNSTKIFNIL